jgi:hypothetical protein
MLKYFNSFEAIEKKEAISLFPNIRCIQFMCSFENEIDSIEIPNVINIDMIKLKFYICAFQSKRNFLFVSKSFYLFTNNNNAY